MVTVMRWLLFLFLSCRLLAQEATQEIPEEIPEDIEVKVPPTEEDEKITERLKRIFAEVNDLKGVEPTVRQGVVTLTGEVPSSEAREQALVIVDKTDGVVYVQDQIDAAVEVSARLNPAKEKALTLFKTTTRKLPLIGIALASVILFWLLGSWVSRHRGFYKRLGLNELSAALLGRVLKLALIGLGIFIALEILDATAIAAGILGVAGVAGVALGFAFRNIVENYLAGILLSMRNPFETGDAVEIGEHHGKVIRLTSRDTVLMTYDGNHLRIPNSVIITSALTNLSRNPLRRFDFAIGVSTDLDLVEVKRLGIETMLSIPSVLEDPAPHIRIDALGDSTVNMSFYGWVNQTKSDFIKTKSEAIRLVKETFDEADVEMPEPIYRVHLHQAGEIKPPSKKAEGERRQVVQDLSVDDTIDDQVAAVTRQDGEANLLADSDQ